MNPKSCIETLLEKDETYDFKIGLKELANLKVNGEIKIDISFCYSRSEKPILYMITIKKNANDFYNINFQIIKKEGQ